MPFYAILLIISVSVIASSSASTKEITDYQKLQVCPSTDLPSYGVWKLAPHQLTGQSVEGCVLSCHTRESCAAASMIAQVCLLASAEAFLTAWLYGGQCETFVNRQRLRRFQDSHTSDLPSSVSVSSLRILYHFRVGPFNLAPVRRNPHTPVLASASLNKSMGVFIGAGSSIQASTADSIDDLFLPIPNVSVFMLARIYVNSAYQYNMLYRLVDCQLHQAGVIVFFNTATRQLSYRYTLPTGSSTIDYTSGSGSFASGSNGSLTAFGLSHQAQEGFVYMGGSLSQLSVGYREARDYNSTADNFQCLRIGGTSSNNMIGWVECFAIAMGKLSADQYDDLSSWCRGKK